MKKLSPSYRKTKEESNAYFVVRLFNRYLPQYFISPRFDPVFNDGLSIRWIKENLRARRLFKSFNPEKTAHVGVFSHSRGGSHVFTSQFHFLDTCFCFSEGFSSPASRGLNFRSFLLRSTFGVNGLQDKQPKVLSHLIYNLNGGKELFWPQWSEDFETNNKRYWIIYLRNPFRTLISLENTGKEKWRLSPEYARQFLADLTRVVERAKDLKSRRPERVKIVCHEEFCQNHELAFHDVCAFLGISRETVVGKKTPEAFFKTFMRCGSKPIVSDGWLMSRTSREKIQGWGGNYNPLSPIFPERAYQADIVSEIRQDIVAIARDVLGQSKVDFWMNDTHHKYEGWEDFILG